MKILKRIGIGILGLMAILLLAALFVKKEYKVEQQVTINKATNTVFDYVKFARNQDQFNKWIMADPQIKKSYKGNDGAVGFVYAWDSEGNAGQGEQEIKSIREGEQVNFVIRFKKPFEGDASAMMKTEAIAANQTKLTWSMTGRNHYPLNILNLVLPSMLGKDMQESLTTLKSVLEKQ